MEDYSGLIYNAFELGSIHDAHALFEACILNAFPTFHFRRLELLRFLRDTPYMEGRSLNHVFEVCKSCMDNNPVWEVHCHRVTMGRTPDKHVCLDYRTLAFVGYLE